MSKDNKMTGFNISNNDGKVVIACGRDIEDRRWIGFNISLINTMQDEYVEKYLHVRRKLLPKIRINAEVITAYQLYKRLADFHRTICPIELHTDRYYTMIAFIKQNGMEFSTNGNDDLIAEYKYNLIRIR